MSASGYSIAAISDIGIGSSVANVIAELPGSKLAEVSMVEIYLTREGVDVLASVTIGGTNVFPAGPVNISTVVGSLPSTQDDNVITALGRPGDDIIIAGTNANAAAQELRALVKVMPLDDTALVAAIKARTGK